jgi:eukaryotic-like serine/threonine-protein kinase
LGNIAIRQGQPERALEHFAEEERIVTHVHGPGHAILAETWLNMALAHENAGREARAVELYQRSLEHGTEKLGSKHVFVAGPLTSLGDHHLRHGDAAAALPLLERAYAVRKAQPGFAGSLGDTQYLLARTLWALGKDRARALQVAHEAEESYQRGGKAYEGELSAVRTWLSSRKPTSGAPVQKR